VPNNQIVVIEDSVNGVKAAHTAGLAVLGLNIDFSEKDLRTAGAIKVFTNLSQTLQNFKSEPIAPS
jgi:beta-phosphoglucomutase-like phosphatase (HAD superfamily)